MIHADGYLATDDMALAVTLILNGFDTDIELHGRQVVWVISAEQFDEDEANIFREDYLRGALRVEPRRFARELAAVRKDMYRVLGIDQQPQGTRVRRQSFG